MQVFPFWRWPLWTTPVQLSLPGMSAGALGFGRTFCLFTSFLNTSYFRKLLPRVCRSHEAVKLHFIQQACRTFVLPAPVCGCTFAASSPLPDLSALTAAQRGWSQASWWTPTSPASSSAHSALLLSRCSQATWPASGGTSPGFSPENHTRVHN